MEPLNVGSDLSSSKRHRLSSNAVTFQLVVLDLFVSSVSAAAGLLFVALLSTVGVNGLDYFWPNLLHEIWFPVGVVLGLALAGSYRRARRSGAQSTFTLMGNFFFAIGVGGLLSIALSTTVHRILGQRQANANHVLSAIILATFLVPVARSLHRHFTLRRHPIRAIIIDSGENVSRYLTHLGLQGGFQVIGWVPGTALRPGEGLGQIDDLEELCAEHQVDLVMVGNYDYPTPVIIDVLRKIQNRVQLTFVPRVFELVSWRSSFTEVSGLPLIEAAPLQMTRFDRFVKRLFDIAVASLTLVLLTPILVVIAAAVKFSSKGPVLYRQSRLGRNGRPFTILKFRTMRVDGINHASHGTAAEGKAPLYESRGKLREEERITGPGRFLRRTGLDELPQLFNVISGSMSIVGPRPFVSAESTGTIGWQSRRYDVRPGITGLWQVSGRNNLSSGDLEELDYLYVASWSMWWDVKILWDTPRTMLKGIGAY